MAIEKGKSEDIGAAGAQSRVANCFVAMPFSDDFLPVWDVIQECVNNLKNEKHKISIIRASERNKAAEIPQNVFNHIKDADIVIVDATECNANVVFEFGYALALKKIIIPMTQGSRKNLPTDFSQYIFESYKLDELDGLLLRLRLRLKDAIKVLEKEEENKQLKADVKIGGDEFNIKCIKNRQHADLAKQFAKAKSEIRIIQTNMTTVVREYLEGIEEAIINSQTNKSTFSVSFLALDPESYFAAIRAQQLGIDASEFRSELHNALLHLYERLGKYPEVEIRLYDDFPTQICFIIDEDIYNCVVSKYQQSRNNCLFKLDSQYPVLHTSFVLHFISVWRDTKTTKRYFPRGHRIIPLEGNA
jgi:nucleoside 2-deoxyribosyltransferase